MNLDGIVQAYTALTESLASMLIARNIASASDGPSAPSESTPESPREQSTVTETAPATPARASNGIATTEKAALPDATQSAQKAANLASQSLASLRSPAASVASDATSLSKLAYLATMAKIASAAQLQSQPNVIAPNAGQFGTLSQGGDLSNDQSAFDVQIAGDTPEATAQQAIATRAALARNTGTIHGTQTPSPLIGEEDAEAPGARGQQADPRLPVGKRTLTAFIPPQMPGDANTADEGFHAQAMNNPSRSPTSLNDAMHPNGEMAGAATDAADAHHRADASARPDGRLAQTLPGQISPKQLASTHATIGQAPFEELLNRSQFQRPGDALYSALGHEQIMGQMQGMNAVILNAAMIPGWPAPRPFEMPKQIAEAQARRLMAQQVEKPAQLGASTQRNAKDEGEIQNYLLNMGMKKSLLSKIRAALRPVKRKIKLLFGLAVLVTQAVFTLHTVLNELKSMEEDEDDMMHDPSEQKRRLKG